MKRFSLILLGCLALGLSTGCCHSWCGRGCGYGAGYGVPTYSAPSYGGGCPSGNCGVNPGVPYTPGQTSYYHSSDSFSAQTGAPQVIDGPVTYGYPQYAVPQTAAAPLQSLPTY